MDSVQVLRAEVARLSRQSTSDFEFTVIALKDMGARMNALAGRWSQVLTNLAVDKTLGLYEQPA